MASEPAQSAASPGGRKSSLLLVGIVAVIMALEGGGIYLTMKMFEPQAADAAAETESHRTPKKAPESELVEIKVVDLKAPWLKTGRTFIFEVQVAVRVPNQAKAVAEKALQDNSALVLDRLSRVIRSAEPAYVEEDGLETIRRQMKHELGVIIGDETIIGEVLIPRFIKFRADY